MDTGRTYDLILSRMEAATLANDASYLYPSYKDDLLLFCSEVLGNRTWNREFDHKAGMWEGQRAVFDSVAKHKYTNVYSSRGTGKDFLAARLILAFFYTRPCRVLCLAPSMRQLQTVLFSEVSKAFNGATQKLEGELQTMKLKMPGDARHYILGIPAGDPDRARGYHAAPEVPGDPDQHSLTDYDLEMIQRMIDDGEDSADEILIVVDEPEGIKQEVFEVLEGTMSKRGATMLKIGNPAMGLFDDHQYTKELREGSKDTNCINLSSIEHSKFPDENSEQLAMFDEVYDKPGDWLIPDVSREKSMLLNNSQDPMFLSDWRGLFSENAMAAQAIPLTALLASQDRYVDHRARQTIGPRVGIDLGFGGDPTVATLVVDGVVCSTYGWRSPRDDKRMQVACAETIMQLCAHWGNEVAAEYPGAWEGGRIEAQRVSVDETGLPGVCDILFDKEMEVDRVNFGGASRGDPTGLVDISIEMINQRANMYWHARQGLADGRYHVPKEERFRDYWDQIPWTLFIRDGRRIKMEPKADIIKRHKHSPDYADSFVLACIPNEGRPIIWSTGGPLMSGGLASVGDKNEPGNSFAKSAAYRSKRQWTKIR